MADALSATARNSNPLTSSAVSGVLLKRIPTLLCCVLFVIEFFEPTGTVAQTPAPAPDQEVVRVNTDLLLFPVRVRDKHGHAITGLTERDLSLRDDERITTSLYFTAGADRVAMVFALDQSGSLQEVIGQQREAAMALFSRFSQRSRIAILRFAQTASLVVPFESDTVAARAAFTFSAARNQRTAIFDAATTALKAFDQLSPDRAERRIVVLISDGLDNSSQTKPSTVIEAALDKHVSFYVIHLPLFAPRDGHLAVREPARGFRDLATRTGGKYFLVGDAKDALTLNKSNDLTPIFQAIEEDLRSQYLLGFYVAEAAHDGKQHNLTVTLGSPGLEFSVAGLGYSRRHKFLVNLPVESPKATP